MNDYVETLIWGIVLFAIVFIVNYLFILKNGYKKLLKKNKKQKVKELKDFVGLSFVVPKFNLDIDKINLNYAFFLISMINAFIISFVFMIIYIVPWPIAFKMLLGFVLLFGLIYALYELLGRHFVKKGWKK